MNNFDVYSVPFVAEAVLAKKWAFASDYIRAYALYTEGGVYFDTDVMIRGKIDFVLSNRAFSAIESYPHLVEKIKKEQLIDEWGNRRNPDMRIHGIQIQAAILGAEKGHPFFRDCLQYYEKVHFESNDEGIPAETAISPIVFAGIAEKYGFKYIDKEQSLDEGFKLYSSDLFCPQPYLMKSEKAVAVHCCNASWRITETPLGHLINNAKVRLKVLLRRIGFLKNDPIERVK